MKLLFPKNDGSVKTSYYKAYFAFVRRWAILACIEVIDTTSDIVWCGGKLNVFSCVLDNKQFIMDYSDHKPVRSELVKLGKPYFKWHYSYDTSFHIKTKNVFPLSILMDFDWKLFCARKVNINYTANGNRILSNQRPRYGALKRRTFVQGMLKDRYGDDFNNDFVKQTDWWNMHTNCLVSVVVPGARNDMLDRGHFEEMGLGVCVICPEIVTVMLRNSKLEPYKHYVPVKSNYSNLIDQIEWCRENRLECVNIGKQAQKLFNAVAPPDNYWSYIKEVLND